MNNNISVIQFELDPERPPDNRELVHRIIINLKLNIFHEVTKIQPLALQRYPSRYMPAILLTNDQANKN